MKCDYHCRREHDCIRKLLGLEVSIFVTIRYSQPTVKLSSLNLIVAIAACITKTRTVQHDHRYEHIPPLWALSAALALTLTLPLAQSLARIP